MKGLSSYFLKLVWSCLASSPHPGQVAFTWMREGEGYRYELTEEGAYEVLYSPLPPERLDALTRPN